jgi:hypothetical protein
MAKRNIFSSEEVARIFTDWPCGGNVSNDPDFSGDLDDLSDVEIASRAWCRYMCCS